MKRLSGEGGEALSQAIRERFKAALVDEFQDTDPVQYSIFQKIYGGNKMPVFFVGDPKQAIYGFRGADVFTYIDCMRRPRLTNSPLEKTGGPQRNWFAPLTRSSS